MMFLVIDIITGIKENKYHSKKVKRAKKKILVDSILSITANDQRRLLEHRNKGWSSRKRLKFLTIILVLKTRGRFNIELE